MAHFRAISFVLAVVIAVCSGQNELANYEDNQHDGNENENYNPGFNFIPTGNRGDETAYNGYSGRGKEREENKENKERENDKENMNNNNWNNNNWNNNHPDNWNNNNQNYPNSWNNNYPNNNNWNSNYPNSNYPNSNYPNSNYPNSNYPNSNYPNNNNWNSDNLNNNNWNNNYPNSNYPNSNYPNNNNWDNDNENNNNWNNNNWNNNNLNNNLLGTRCIQQKNLDVRPHPFDCTRFTVCSGGRLITMQCSPGSVFHEQSGSCVPQNSYLDTCTRRQQTQLGGVGCRPGATYMKAHPRECAQYYHCGRPAQEQRWEANLQECAYPWLFNERTNRCEHYSMVNCGVRREPMDPCDYKVEECLSGHCVPCRIRHPSCKGRMDGMNAWAGKENSPYYVVCANQRVVYKGMCSQSRGVQLFDRMNRVCRLQ